MTGAQNVHIAGLGAICSAGTHIQAFWKALFQSPGEPDRDALKFPSNLGQDWRHAYRIPGATCHPRKFEAIALVAIREALRDAQRRGYEFDGRCIGLALGTAAGDTRSAEEGRFTDSTSAFTACNPYGLLSGIEGQLPIELSGPSFINANACAAGLYALTHAMQLLRGGMADVMIVVGVDILSRVTQAGFQRMQALDPDRCRPFDARRQGTVLGEGAAAAVLVRVPAVQTDPSMYCRIAGVGLSCDAHHPTAPQPDGRGVKHAIDQALRNAQIGAADIDLVVPHGTGTQLNDRIEADVLAQTFGDVEAAPPLLSIKSHIGHTAGASGMFSMLAAASALDRRELPGGRGCPQPDPALRVHLPDDIVELKARRPLRALVNTCAFGGNNVSLILQGGRP